MHPTEAEFRAAPGTRRVTQCDKILTCLQNAQGHWVELPDLVRSSGAYAVHSRVSDLRKRGFKIEQRNTHTADHKINSSYRLAEA